MLGIEHHTVDLRDVFRESIIEPFCSCYLRGQTPNPCVLCNRTIKFGAMLQFAQSLGAQKIATGHYAQTKREGGRTLLLRAQNRKDQSYFLCMLTQAQLAAAVFPVSGYEKDDLRLLAEKAGLPVARKKDSQDVCFIPDNDYAAFLMHTCKTQPQPGDFVDTDGNVIGPSIPLHISRFFPRFHMTDRPPTDIRRICRLADIAKEKLRFVYTGNC